MAAVLRFLGIIFTALMSGAAFAFAAAVVGGFTRIAVVAILRAMGLIPKDGAPWEIYLWKEGPPLTMDDILVFMQMKAQSVVIDAE